MADKIEKIGKSLIHHGKQNDRVYIMKLHSDDFREVMERIDTLCRVGNYSKIFAKVPESQAEGLMERGYRKEAQIARLYGGRETGLFLGKFLKDERARRKDESRIREVREIVESREKSAAVPCLPEEFRLGELAEEDAGAMAGLYKSVFATYPFPVFDQEYLKETMRDNILYGGIFYKDTLVSVASAETCPEYLNAEMTDFATLSGFTGHSFSLVLLNYLEKKLEARGYKTFYTIARAVSVPMNITFRKAGYEFAGTLLNNTDIAGSIESMNVWYRESV